MNTIEVVLAALGGGVVGLIIVAGRWARRKAPRPTSEHEREQAVVLESEVLRHRLESDAYLNQLRRKQSPFNLEPGSVWVTIYLSDAAGHEQVEAAVENYLKSLGFRIQGSEGARFGSFSIRKWFK